MLKNFLQTLICFFLLPSFAFALTYPLPYPGNDIVGYTKIIQAKRGQYLNKIARNYEMGIDELKSANPHAPPYVFKKSRLVVIPSIFLLPDAPRRGIIINLAEKRLYYYPSDEPVVITEPISVGKEYWSTPLLDTYVLEKIEKPTWVVPDSIREASARKGIILPDVVPPGPENPLGDFALRLANWSVLIHGTNQPQLIGKRVSSGCIRMYPEDIEHLFNSVKVKTPVFIMNEPYKFGWQNGQLYLEVHPAFLEFSGSRSEEENLVHDIIKAFTQYDPHIKIDWKAVNKIIREQTGIPYQISMSDYHSENAPYYR